MNYEEAIIRLRTYDDIVIGNDNSSIDLAIKKAIEALEKQIPIVRGEWKENEEGLLVCSVCNEEAITVDVTEYEYEDEENLLLCDYCPRECGYHRESIRTDFCPNCGADMRGN